MTTEQINLELQSAGGVHASEMVDAAYDEMIDCLHAANLQAQYACYSYEEDR